MHIGQHARVGDNDTDAGQKLFYSNLCWIQDNIWRTSLEESHFHSSYDEVPHVTGKEKWERDRVPSPSVHPFCLCPLARKDLGRQRKAVLLRLTPILSFPLCLHVLSSPVSLPRAWKEAPFQRAGIGGTEREPWKGTESKNKELLRTSRTLWKGWMPLLTCPG